MLATDKLKPEEAVDLGTEYSSKDKASRPGGRGGRAEDQESCSSKGPEAGHFRTGATPRTPA